MLLDTKPELRDLIDLLAPLAPTYLAVGVRLNIPMYELDLIDLPQFYQQNLVTTLEWWMKNGDKVGSPVSWDTIIAAIDTDVIGNYEVLKKVKDFVSITQSTERCVTHPNISQFNTILHVLTCIIVLLLDAKPELRDLVDLLAPLASKYRYVGFRLNVPVDELGLIDLPQFYQMNLVTVLEWWIENGDRVDSPVTFWDTIIAAIDTDVIGDYEVVKNVKDFVSPWKAEDFSGI